jgi:glycosyltransferase involved in cell wall biosynthesis
VSVVIPCYNQAHFLGEAIESVLAQSHPNFEIVVVDDGSPDNTSEVAARYPGVRCVRQENQGLAAARNTGLRCSNGSYLLFLDADDRLLPEALEVGLECFDAHPECAFVSGHYREMSVDGSPLPTEKQPHIEEKHYIEILRCNYVITPAVVMYRRSVFDSVGGFNTSSSVRGSEDSDLCLRVARQFPVYCHGKVVADYRLHGTSMSHNSALMLKATITVRRSQLEHVKGNKQYEEAIEKGVRASQDYYGGRLISELRTHVREREWKPVLRGMLVLLRYYPHGLLVLLSKRYRLAQELQDREQQLARQLWASNQRLRELREQNQRLRRRVQKLDRQLQSMQSSKSWKLLEKVGYLRAKISKR